MVVTFIIPCFPDLVSTCYFVQNSPIYVVCCVPTAMRWFQEMQLCACPIALSWTELPPTCWVLILSCFYCGSLRGSLRRQLCSKMQPLLSANYVDLSPGNSSPHRPQSMIYILKANVIKVWNGLKVTMELWLEKLNIKLICNFELLLLSGCMSL